MVHFSLTELVATIYGIPHRKVGFAFFVGKPWLGKSEER